MPLAHASRRSAGASVTVAPSAVMVSNAVVTALSSSSRYHSFAASAPVARRLARGVREPLVPVGVRAQPAAYCAPSPARVM